MNLEPSHLLCLSLVFASACVVEDADDDDASAETEAGDDGNADAGNGDDSAGDDSAGDDSAGDDSAGDDSAGDDSAGDDSAGDDSAGDDSAGDDSAADDSAGDSGSGGDDGPPGDAVPEEGAWQYSETGGTTNDCTFVANPSNGWGTYLIETASAAGFTVVPGDDTGPFDCELDSGEFHCPERLVDTLDQPGLDIVANVFVVVDGRVLTSTEMTGSQLGRIDCEGSQCTEAELYLGVSFPCEFEIPFEGSKS